MVDADDAGVVTVKCQLVHGAGFKGAGQSSRHKVDMGSKISWFGGHMARTVRELKVCNNSALEQRKLASR